MQPKGKFFFLIAVLSARPCGTGISVPVDNYVLLKADDVFVHERRYDAILKEQSEIPGLSEGTTLYLLVMHHDGNSRYQATHGYSPFFLVSPLKNKVMDASGSRIP